jgi:hypothetical protein
MACSASDSLRWSGSASVRGSVGTSILLRQARRLTSVQSGVWRRSGSVLCTTARGGMSIVRTPTTTTRS